MPALNGFKTRLDPRRFNGAIFQDYEVCSQKHGARTKIGFAYALDEAFHEAQSDSITKIEKGITAQLLVLNENIAD